MSKLLNYGFERKMSGMATKNGCGDLNPKLLNKVEEEGTGEPLKTSKNPLPIETIFAVIGKISSGLAQAFGLLKGNGLWALAATNMGKLLGEMIDGSELTMETLSMLYQACVPAPHGVARLSVRSN
jgi:hypothetical protein